jgi:hypothetical protein
MCDDPVCFPECKIVSEPIICRCDNPLIFPTCRTRCPPNQCEKNQCPACEIICEPTTGCENIECEQLVTSWACRKPSNCALPHCELMCEQPVCRYLGLEDQWKESEKNGISWLAVILIVIFVGFGIHKYKR